jgi:capsular exopolysaccharide synthesis family protein
MSSHSAVPESAPLPADPTLVPVPSPGGLPPAEAPVEAGRPDWYGGALAPPPGLAAGPNAATLLKGLLRRWWLALGLGLLLAGGAAAAAWVLLEPKWTAVAEVHIDPYPPWLLTRGIDTVADRNEFINYERWQAAQMKSQFVISQARKRDDVKNLAIIRQQPDPMQYLDDEIKVEYKDGDEILAITMLGSDPEAVKAIVNGIRKEYFEAVVKEERLAREKRKREVAAVVDQTERQLNEHQRNLQGLAKQLGITVTGQLPQAQLDTRIALLEKQRQLFQVQTERTKLEAQLKTYLAQAKELTVPAPSEQDVAQALDLDPTGHDLQQRQERWAGIVADYEQTVRDPSEPGLLSARRKLRVVQQALAKRRAELSTALIEGVRQKARVDFDALLRDLRTQIAAKKSEEEGLQGQVKGVESDKSALGESSVEFTQREYEITQERERLSKLRNELSNLEVELRPGVPPRVTEYQDAHLLKRDLKKQILGVILAPLAMLVLTCFGVAWWECRARRIHTADEVASGLGVRVVGAVPPLRNAARLVAAGEGQVDIHVHSLLESIDSIRTVLLRDAHVEATRVVMVTSAVGGEGKTTLASHLAGSLARAGRRTLLIDCDLRRPSAHQLFELPLQPGFSEAILGEVHIAEATLSTPVDGLWMIPAGQWDREVLQALARDGLHKVFDKLKNEYDFIVIDSHPVLPATDSLLIGQHVDAVILSVMRGVSQAPKVYGAYQRLATLGIRIFGAVVNGLPDEDVYAGGYQYTAPAAR